MKDSDILFSNFSNHSNTAHSDRKIYYRIERLLLEVSKKVIKKEVKIYYRIERAANVYLTLSCAVTGKIYYRIERVNGIIEVESPDILMKIYYRIESSLYSCDAFGFMSFRRSTIELKGRGSKMAEQIRTQEGRSTIELKAPAIRCFPRGRHSLEDLL